MAPECSGVRDAARAAVKAISDLESRTEHSSVQVMHAQQTRGLLAGLVVAWALSGCGSPCYTRTVRSVLPRAGFHTEQICPNSGPFEDKEDDHPKPLIEGKP
jgi:hypothetical protein